jgi:hypothetical protein
MLAYTQIHLSFYLYLYLHYGLENLTIGLQFLARAEILFIVVSRMTLGLIQSSTLWVPRAKRAGMRSWALPSLSTKVNNACSCIVTPLNVFMAWSLMNHKNNKQINRSPFITSLRFSILSKILTSGKSKVALCSINQAPRNEDRCGSGGIAPSFLTSALDGDQLSASCNGRFTTREASPGTHWMKVGESQSRFGSFGEEKISYLCRESKPRRPARNPSLYRLNYPGSTNA